MRFLRVIIVIIFLGSVVLLGWTIENVLKKDTIPPKITDEVGELHVGVKDDKKAWLKGLSANDDRDGDITDKILIERVSRFLEPGKCQVNYVVFDQGNNFSRHQRDIYFDDYQSPRLSLDKPLMYRSGEHIMFTDRLHLWDSIDGDLDYKIKIESSNVRNSEVGVYEIELHAVTNYGDEVRTRIPVNIVDYSTDGPEIELKQYLAYVKKGEFFDPLSYVTSVVDTDGGEIDKSLISIHSQVDFSKVGGGQICLEVTNSKGFRGSTYLTIIVEE